MVKGETGVSDSLRLGKTKVKTKHDNDASFIVWASDDLNTTTTTARLLGYRLQTWGRRVEAD